MSGHVGTRVQIPVILGKKVHIMEDKAVPVKVLERLPKTDVHEHCPVELVGVCLVDDVEPVVDLLLGQEWVNVAEEDKQLIISISENIVMRNLMNII